MRGKRVARRLGQIADWAVRGTIYAAVVLLPLVYWDGLSGPFTMAKTALLWFLALWGTTFWLLRLCLWSEGWKLLKLPLGLPWLAVILTFALSGWASINPHLSVYGNYYRMEGLYTFLATLVFYPIVATTFTGRKQIRTLLAAMVAAGSIAALVAASQVFGWGIGPGLFGNRAQSTFGNPNFSGNYFAMVSVAALGLALLYHSDWKKTLALAGFGLNLFGMLASFTRGAWIAFGLALLVLILATWGLLRKNLPWLGTAVLVVVIAAGVLFLTPFGARLIPRAATLLQAETFFKDRGVFWEAGWLTALHYPVLGSGPETLRLSHRPYKTADYLLMEEARKAQYSGLDRAHNEFVDVVAMRGFVGLAAYLWFLVAWVLRWRKSWRRGQDKTTKGLLAILLASWAAYLIANVFNFGMAGITPIFWILCGVAGAFAFILPAKKGKPEEEAPPAPVVFSLARRTIWLWFVPLALILLVASGFATYRIGVVVAADVRFGQSLEARRLGEEEKAVALNEQVVQLRPEEGQYWLGLGVVYLDLAETQTVTSEKVASLVAARAPLETALPLTDQPDNAWVNLASSYWSEAETLGKLEPGNLPAGAQPLLEKARDLFWTCLQFDQTLPHVWFYLSDISYLLSNWSTAKEAGLQAIRLDPDYANAYLFLAKTEIQLADLPSAREHLQKVLALEPNNAEAKLLLELLK